jgi:hypothetical protein
VGIVRTQHGGDINGSDGEWRQGRGLLGTRCWSPAVVTLGQRRWQQRVRCNDAMDGIYDAEYNRLGGSRVHKRISNDERQSNRPEQVEDGGYFGTCRDPQAALAMVRGWRACKGGGKKDATRAVSPTTEMRGGTAGRAGAM